MCGLHIAHVEIVVRKYRATHRPYQNRTVLDAEFIDRLGQHLVHRAVAAAGAIVRYVLQIFFAVIALVEGLGP